MTRCYQAVCRTEEEACEAWDATYDVFDGLEEASGHARKRYAESLLWRFDDDLPVVERMATALRKTGLFTEVREIPEKFFLSARSYAV